TPGRRDEWHVSGCVGRDLDERQTSSSSKSDSVLDCALRHLRELVDYDLRRRFRYCSCKSNFVCGLPWATLAGEARCGRIPERSHRDHRGLASASLGPSTPRKNTIDRIIIQRMKKAQRSHA